MDLKANDPAPDPRHPSTSASPPADAPGAPHHNAPAIDGESNSVAPARSRWRWPSLRFPKLRIPRFRIPGLSRVSRTKRVIATLAVASAAIAVSGSWWYSCGYDGCPTVAQLRAWQPTEGGMLLDRSGAIIAPLSPVKRVNVPISRVPQQLQAAFIAVEDRRFREHHGIDWYGVARAAVSNVRAGGVREGASTISMQLARNVFLSHRALERSFTRKLLEVRYATLLESALTKDEILERYLNAIYLGNGVYGVEGASRDLFGKSMKSVTLAEVALLAGLPKAPSGYSPRRDAARASARRDVVLSVLERENVATAAAIATARATPIMVPSAEWEPRVVDSWAVEVVRGTLDSLRKIGVIPATLNDGQLRVRSSFDRRAQIAAERAIAGGAAQVDAERWDMNGRTQGALVAIDPSTGAIIALVGGRRIERRGFNRALRAHRQPGSAFKPFVYATALMRGYTSATMVDDEPIEIEMGRDNTWTPANFDNEYAGSITMQDALARSSNAATVRISRDVGIQRVAAQAHAQGIVSDLPLVPALALGAGAVTPIELTAAYAPFGNGGKRITPFAVERVEDVFGRVLWQHPSAGTEQVLQPADAFLVTSLLRGVVDDGTGRGVRAAGVRGPVAGKTGTTNDGADVWFVGYTPTLVASVWFGADEPQPLGGNATGGRLAAPVWARFIKEGWHSPDRDSAWRAPVGVESRQIDLASGKLAADYCGESRRAWFRAGTAPKETCDGENPFRIALRELGDLVDGDDEPRPPSPMPPPRPSRPTNVRVNIGNHDFTSAVGSILGAIARNTGGREVTHKIMEELRRAKARSDRAQRRADEQARKQQQLAMQRQRQTY